MMDVDAGAEEIREQEIADELQAAHFRVFGPPETVPKTTESSYYAQTLYEQMRKENDELL